jgi:hypothetical protein
MDIDDWNDSVVSCIAIDDTERSTFIENQRRKAEEKATRKRRKEEIAQLEEMKQKKKALQDKFKDARTEDELNEIMKEIQDISLEESRLEALQKQQIISEDKYEKTFTVLSTDEAATEFSDDTCPICCDKYTDEMVMAKLNCCQVIMCESCATHLTKACPYCRKIL